MAFWGQDLIDQVRSAVNIVDVIGSYVPLKRAGSNWKGLSPFTNEKTPSFHVNDAKQQWYCFSSNQGGDVFKFVQLRENIDFPEAVRMLAKRASIELPEGSSPRDGSGADSSLKDQLYEVHEKVAVYWNRLLHRSPGAQAARNYLTARGITSETAKSFLIGYCPDSWDATLNWLDSEGYPESVLEQSGLVSRSPTSNRLYDRFKGRLMIPICNESGRVIAFSGRSLTAEAFGGKYVNSPETPLFKKSRVLFGLDKHKREMIQARMAILVEGHLDLVMCHQAGVLNTVASQGTAFTEHHARILKRHVDEVVICFDSDSAGQRATTQAAVHLLAEELPVRVLRLPDGADGAKHDPDSFIRQNGAADFRELAEAAPEFWQWYLQEKGAEHDVRSDRGRAGMKRDCLELLKSFQDATRVEQSLMQLGARLGLADHKVLRAELDRMRRATPVRQATSSGDGTPSFQPYNKRGEPAPNLNDSVPSEPEFITPHPIVTELLKLLLQDPRRAAIAHERLDLRWLSGQDGEQLLRDLLEHLKDVTLDSGADDFLSEPGSEPSPALTERVDGWLSQRTGAEQNFFARILVKSGDHKPEEVKVGADIPVDTFTSALRILEREWYDREVKRVEVQIRDCNNPELSAELFPLLLDLRKRRDKLPLPGQRSPG